MDKNIWISKKGEMNYFIIILFFAILSFRNYFAQDIKFEHILTTDGLSQNSITCILQDSTGFLWFGTYDGLNRYDGYNFKIFKNDPQNPTSLSHNFIRSMCVDQSGKLWIGTMGGGLMQYIPETEQFISYKHDPNNPNSLSNNSVTALHVDHSGDLWIGTWEGGLNKLVYINKSKQISNGKEENLTEIKFIHYQNDDVKVNNTEWNKIASIYEDPSGILWLGTRYGVSKFDTKKEQFKHYFSDPFNTNSLTSNNISAISEDKEGNLWIATWDRGLNKFIREEEWFIRYPFIPGSKNGPSHQMIMCMNKDRSDDLWIGTWGGGLNKLVLSNSSTNIKQQLDQFIHYQTNKYDPYSISDNYIYSIYEDRSGVLWVGTDWNGLNKYDKNQDYFVHYRGDVNNPNTLNKNTIFSFHKDRSGIIWIGTRDGGINLFNRQKNKFSYYMNNPKNPHSLIHNTVRVIYEDRRGTIWIGTEIGLDKFDNETKKFIHYTINPENPVSSNIFTICDDQFDNLWIGTYHAGLFKFNPKNGNIKKYKHEPNDLHSIGDNIIWSIHEDVLGNLWIATDNGGLNKYDYQNDQFIRYVNDPTDSSSISSNKVLTIYENKSGELWLGTTAGLNKMIRNIDNDSSPTFIHYTKEDGLPTNTIHGILEDNNGCLWISTNNGLSKFDPKIETFKNFDVSDGLQADEFSVSSCLKDEISGEMYFGGINGFNIFHPDQIQDNLVIPSIVITDFKIFNKTVPIGQNMNDRIIFKKSIMVTDEIELSYNENVFSIEFAALHFNSPASNLYAHKLEGFEKDWYYVSANERTATYTNLDPGEYIFHVKASNNDGIWNKKGSSLKIIITPPFWQTFWFRFLTFILIISLFVISMNIRTNRIRKQNRELEERVSRRTAQLEATNKELEAFTYTVSHDLRAPLRSMSGFSRIILEEYINKIDEKGKDYLKRINTASQQMGKLIEDLLKFSRLTRLEMNFEKIDLSAIAESVIMDLQHREPERKVTFDITPSLFTRGDRALLKVMIRNLLSNAWKFTSQNTLAKIEFGKTNNRNEQIFYIKDNGIGFEMKYVDKLFKPFQRLHKGYKGTGIGLSTVQRIIQRHNGRIWAEGKVNEGATFYFILGGK